MVTYDSGSFSGKSDKEIFSIMRLLCATPASEAMDPANAFFKEGRDQRANANSGQSVNSA